MKKTHLFLDVLLLDLYQELFTENGFGYYIVICATLLATHTNRHNLVSFAVELWN